MDETQNVCTDCGTKLDDTDQTKCAEHGPEYTCKECGASFADKADCEDHKSSMHAN